MVAYLPSGWPTGVHPPGSEEFERTAVVWLLDVVPPDYRMHGVLRRHPVALATLARRHLAACVEGARQGYRTARTDLGDVLPVSGLDAVLAAYRSEGSRLVTAARAADLVEQALRGKEFTPPLHDSASGSPALPGPPAPARSRVPSGSLDPSGSPAPARSPAPSASLDPSASPVPACSPAPAGPLTPSRSVTPPRPTTPSDVPRLRDVPDLDGAPGQVGPSASSVGREQRATPDKRRPKASTPGKASSPGKQQKQPTRGKQRRAQTVS
jgi:hypothetical protein